MIDFPVGDPIPLSFQERDTSITILFDGNSPFTFGTKLRKAEGIYHYIKENGYSGIQLVGDPNSNYLSAFTLYFYSKKIPTYNIHISRSGYKSGNRILTERFSTKFLEFSKYKEEFFSSVHPQFNSFQSNFYRPTFQKLEEKGIFPVPRWGISQFSIKNIQNVMEKILNLYKINTIYIDIGSGLTYLSFLNYENLGKVKVVGVCIGLPMKKMIPYLKDLEFRLFNKVSTYSLLDLQEGDKFGKKRTEDLEFIKRLREKKIYLDPIYSAKSFLRILLEEKEKGREGVFYFHQGGLLPGLIV